MGILKTKRTKRKASLAIVICLLAQLVSPWSLGVDASVSTDLSTIGASTQNTNAQFAPIQLANVSSVIPSVYGGTELISRGFASSFQAGGNGQSQSPSISRDGRYLTFVSFASDLAEDAGTVSYSDMQVFLHDRLTGQTELVSYEFNKLNFPANGAFTRKPAISADGRYVVFESNASNLVPEDMLGHKDIFVWNRSTKEVKRVNVTSSGTEADSDSMNPTISAEGNYVLFQSDASNLKQPGVADNYVNTFRVEVATGSIKQINDPNGSPESPILSGNGQYAIYLHNGFIYVYDFNNSDPAYTPEKMEIQKTNPDPSVEVTYETPAISEDGRHIAYKVNEWKNDVFQNKYTEILDREGGNLQPVRIGIAFPYQEETISLSADGKSVVYPARSQDYPDLVPIDERKEVDLFVGRLDNGTLTVERATLPVGRGDSYFSPSISNSGVVAFSDYYDVFASYDRDAALEWPNGAAMTVVKNDQGNHVLNWPTINDASIRGYHIYQLDKFFGEFSDRRTLKGFVPPEASSFVVEGLDQSDLEPRFAVYAVNDTFNKSITPLITQYTVEDTLPPYWPNNVTSFRAEEVSTSSAVLKWNSAMDTSGRVASYKIWRLLNGTRIPLAETNFPFINLENLTPGQTYTLVMQASDEAGNWSPDTAPITFDTLLGGDQNVVLQAEYQHGMIALNWTAASHDKGVVSYSVFRKWGAGASTEIGKVNAPEHSYEDRHVQEGEPYIYQVKGYNAADQEVYATGSKAVSTGELQVPTLSYDVQLVDNHYLPVNGTLSLRATGQSNKAVTVTVSYRSWFDPNGIKLPIPRQFESKVNLQESSGELGAYIGAFTMPNGVSEISWLRADITSGGNVIKGNELAVNKLTAAALKVSFNLAHLNELTRGKLLSAIKGANANLSLNINGDTLTEDFQDFDQSFTFSNLSPDAYVSGVRLGDFFSVAGIGLQPGLTRQVVLSHIINNPTLKVVLKDSSGRPLSGMEVRYEEDGNELFRGYTDTNGQVQASLPPLSSGKVKVDVSYTKYMPVMGEPVEVSYGEVTKNITLNEYDFAPLSGKAVDHLGQPVGDVTIFGTQLLNGSYVSTSTQTDRNGNYALNLYPSDVAGEAEIRISDYSGLLKIPDAIRLDIPYGGTQYNPTLPRLVEGYIILKVLNKRVDGQMEGPEKVDAAKLKEWNVTLRDRNGTRGYLDEYPIRTYGFPGDEVELCISNYNLVYEGCKKVQTDQDNSAIFEMTFEEQSKFLAKVMQNDAMVHDENISTYLSRWDESNGNWSSLATLKMNPIDISLPAGKYQYEISSYHGGNVAGEFELIDGDVYDAGEIEIVQIGRFAGWPGNELTSTLSQAVPGDVIPMRGAFRNPYGSETSDTYLNIEIPKGTELVAGSVVYGGTPILETTVTDSVYSIRLGEVGAYVQGNIRYKLKLSDSYSATDLIARLSMTWQGGQETIARKVIPTSFVSMDVQSTVHSDTLQISGRAPGNAIVTLFDGSAVIGQTKAYPGGYWTAQVKLADLGQPSRHLLRAEASWNGKIEVTDIYLVIFEPDEARLQQLVMKQFNGKVVTINPENGVARFPFTIHPSLATTFEAHFAEPDRVEAVRLRFAGDEPVEMEQDQNGVFRADVIAGYKAGKVYIEYKTKKPSNLSKTESELKASLPPALRNFTDNVTLIDQDQAAGKQGGVQFDMGNLHITSETYSLPNDGYQLTDEEEQETEAGTVKAFNPKLEWTLDGTKLDIELSYYVPIPEQKVASKQHGRVQILSFIGTGFKLIKREFSVDLKDKERLEKMREKLEEANENVEDGKDAIEQISANFDISVEFASRMQRLEMLAALAATCPKTNEIENPFILRKMNYVAVQSTTITVVSLVNFLNPIPIDVIGIDPLGDAIDRIGNQLDESIDRMEESIRSSIQFFCPPDDNGDGSGGTGGTSGSGSKGGGSGGGWSGGAAADPVYIYDPSGYVYEAVEDNRVEGVKATVFQLQDGKWVAWDAEWFGQFNPQTTDTEGKYAWDVPNGMWKVVYEKEGYLPTQSAELEVPPPHFDVNVPIVSLEAPTATSIEGFTTSGSEANTEILVNFSKYIDTGLALNGAITVTKGGNAVTGTISAPSAQIDSSGRSLTQSLLFKLTAAESPQSTLAVAIDNAYVVSYAGTMMVADYETNITVVDKDVVGPILSSTTIGAKGKEIRLLFNEGIDPNSLLSVEGITLEGTEALASGMVLDPTVAGNKGVKLLLDLAVASGGEIQINVAANRFRDLKGNGSSEIIQYSVNNNLPSSDVTLASLKINQGSIALQPAFSQSASRYTVSVPKGTDVVVDATASSTEASIRINEILYKGDSLLVNAEADETMIPIVVTAKNGTKGYYTVVVKRTLPDIGNGSGSGSGSAASPGRGLKIKEYLEESGIRVAEYEFTAADIQSRIIDGEAIIELSQQADKQVALMPVTVVQELIAKNGKLIVKTGEIKLVIPAAVMDQSAILKALGTTADQVKVRLQILKISDTSVHANLVNDAKGEGVLRNTGVVYEFLLQAEAGGSKLPISNFNDHPVTGEIAWMPEFQQLGAEHMVGVYKFNESNGQWVWTPSKVERANNRILFKTDSFSRYAVMAYGVNFTDTAAHWGRTNIEALASRSVIQGTGANRFEPEKQVTRAEFASMLVRAVGSVKTAKSGTTFPDVSEADWFHDAVLRAADMGIIHGYEDGTFRPKETITRQQMAVMIARSMSSTGLTPDGNTEDASKQLNGFNDKAEVQPWASAEMAQALKFGFIQGKGDRLLAPSDTATRAEAATMLLRLMNVISF